MAAKNLNQFNLIDRAVMHSFQHLADPCSSSSLKPISYLNGSQKLIEHVQRQENLLQSIQIGATDGLDLALTTLRTLLKDCKTGDDCRLTVDKFAYALGAMDATSDQCAIIHRIHG